MELYSQLPLKLQWRLKEDNYYEVGQKKKNGNKADSGKKKVCLSISSFCIGSYSFCARGKSVVRSFYWTGLWSRQSHCKVAQGTWTVYHAVQDTSGTSSLLQEHIPLNE